MSRNEHFASGAGFELHHEVGDPAASPVEGRIRAHIAGQQVGEMVYHVSEHAFDRTGLYVDNVDVHEEHRRKGIAAAMYDDMQKVHDYPVIHSDEAMTDMGKAAVKRVAAKRPGKHLLYDGISSRPL